LWWVGRRWAAAWHYSATLPLTVSLPTTTTGYHML